MKKINLEDVRIILKDMGNTYVSLLTNEELSSASLQDDLGMEESEVTELIDRLEKVGCFFIFEAARRFLEKQQSVSVYQLRRICEEYAVDSKPFVS